MQKILIKSPIKINVKLFQTKTDIQLREKYKVTKQRIGQLRKKLAPETNSRQIAFDQRTRVIDNKILKYIKYKKRCDKNINISEFLKNYHLMGASRSTTQTINQARFLKVAKQNKIKIKFVYEYCDDNLHGLHCATRSRRHLKKCNCDIYKLANRIKGHYYKTYGICPPVIIVNKLANKYVDNYNQLNPSRIRSKTLMKDFYKNIDKIICKFMKSNNL